MVHHPGSGWFLRAGSSTQCFIHSPQWYSSNSTILFNALQISTTLDNATLRFECVCSLLTHNCVYVKKSTIVRTSVHNTYPLACMRRNWRTMRATADIRSRNCLAGPGKCHRGCRICCPPPIVAPHHHQSNVANFCCPETISPPTPISITNDAFPSRPIFQDFCKSYFSTWQHDSCLNRSNLIPQIVLTQLLILLADRNSKTKPSFIIPRYVIHLSYLCLPEAYILHRLKPTIVQLCFCKFQKCSSSQNT